MRILQLNNRLPWPLNDGGNIATWHVTKYLHEFGHTVTLAALNTSKHRQDPKVLSDIAEVHAVDIDTSVSPIGALVALFGSLPYNLKRFESPDFRALLVRLLTENAFDIILVETSYMALYLDTLRAHTSCPIILRSHNIEHQIWERLAEAASNPLKGWYFRHLAKKIKRFEIDTADQFDGIVAITADDLTWYSDHTKSVQLTSINAGANLDRFTTTPPTHPLKMCFLGSLEWEPNVQGLRWFLDAAWPLIRAAWPEAELHVAGKNPPDSLKMLTVPGMVFHGEIPNVETFLSTYGILVVPLLSGGGMRLKVVEAMAAGKCVLSTSIGAEGIAYTDGTDLLIADTPEAFRDQAINLQAHPDRVTQIGQAAMQLAREKYDWAQLVRRFEAFFETHLQPSSKR